MERLEPRALFTADFGFVATLKGSDFNAGRDVVTDAEGNVYVTGVGHSSTTFDDNTPAVTRPYYDAYYNYLAKFNASGKQLWIRDLAVGTRYCEPGWLTVDRAGDVIVAHSLHFGWSDVINDTEDALTVVKYDRDGRLKWSRAAKSPGWSSFRARGIATDSTNNILITGEFGNTFDFDPGSGVKPLTSDPGGNGFVWKLSSAGDFVAVRNIGGAGRGIALDQQNNVLITGEFGGVKDFDPAAGVKSLASAGSRDAFVLELNASLNYVSAVRVGGTGDDLAESIVVNAKGDYWICGQFQQTVDLNPGTGTANVTSAGGADAFLAAFTSSGSFRYGQRIGGTGVDDTAVDLALDPLGNVYATGNFRGTVDFDPGTAILNRTAQANQDIFISKITDAGALVWNRVFSGSETDLVSAIHVDRSFNVYTTGLYSGTTDFDPGASTVSRSSFVQTISNTFVSKLLAARPDYSTHVQIGGSGAENAVAIASDASGNAYVLGTFSGTVDFDPGSGMVNLTAATAGTAFVAKYNPSGRLVWAKSLGATLSALGKAAIVADASGSAIVAYTIARAGVSGDSTAVVAKLNSADGAVAYSRRFDGAAVGALAVDPAGNILVSGAFHGTVDFDPTSGTASATAVGVTDQFLLKLAAAGTRAWSKQLGGADTNSFTISALAAGVAGDVLAAGEFRGSNVDFDPGSGTQSRSSTRSAGFVLKLTSGGSWGSAQIFAGTGSAAALGLAVDAADNVFVTGSFDGAIDFNPSSTVTRTLTSAGGRDIFLLKLSKSGSLGYANKYGGTGTDVGGGIAVDAAGNVVIRGSYTGAVTFGTTTLSSGGSFLARFNSSGAPIWSARCSSVAIALAPSGSFLHIASTFSGSADVDPGSVTRNVTSKGGTDALVTTLVM